MLTSVRCDYGLNDVIESVLEGEDELRYALCLGKYESTVFFSAVRDYLLFNDERWNVPRWLRQS